MNQLVSFARAADAVRAYLVLPSDVSARERAYLKRVNRVALAFLWVHVPAFALVALVNDTGVVAALALTTAVVLGPTLLLPLAPPRVMAPVFGFAAMCLGGLLVHFGQGIVQIEMHFYFFVLLAALAVFGNPLAIVVAAVTVAAHHALLWLLVPSSVFNYEAPFWVVGIHAIFVVIESIAACFVARSFYDNVIQLEKIIEERTAEIEHKNAEMRRILDTVEEGLVVVDQRGAMAGERSAILERWLGAPVDGDTFFTWLARSAGDQAAWLRLCFDALFDDVLPVEVVLGQMPRDVVVGGRVLSLAVQLLHKSGAHEEAMLAFTDVTLAREAERAEARRHDTVALLEALVRDRAAVAEFVDEAQAMVTQIATSGAASTAEARRIAHTLKGNAGLFGLSRLVHAAHELEQSIADDDTADAPTHAAPLVAAFDEAVANVMPLLVEDGRLDVAEDDLAIIAAHLRAADVDAALHTVEGLRGERGRRRLDRLAQHAHALARRFDKDVDVVVACAPSLRVSSSLRPLWASAVHLVRNAIDHGIEPASMRAGKDPCGRITLSLHEDADATVFTVVDDGRGIDWARLEAKARALGLPFTTEPDRVAALFAPGLSTKDAVTDVSGRGLGMDAVHAAVSQLGGAVRVTSTRGIGTSITIRIPRTAAALATTTGTGTTGTREAA